MSNMSPSFDAYPPAGTSVRKMASTRDNPELVPILEHQLFNRGKSDFR
jgi:hypothetical protein